MQLAYIDSPFGKNLISEMNSTEPRINTFDPTFEFRTQYIRMRQ